MLREIYLHPKGQIPAYEWNFSDVNPPVHAWATIFLYRMEQALRGQGDIEFMKRFHKELTESGELVGAEGMASPGEARVVRAGKGGAPEVTDGPFPEAKEFLAGYWIVDVETTERAYALAARASAAPGKGGMPLNMAIEVRQVMSAPPVEV